MKNLTRNEATAIVAEVLEVRYTAGYDHTDGEWVPAMIFWNDNWIDFDPFSETQLHWCVWALEAWRLQDPDLRSWETQGPRLYSGVSGFWCCLMPTEDLFDTITGASEQDLNVAIIAALCSAHLGKQVQIEGGE